MTRRQMLTGIKNGNVARSPFFVLTITGGMGALATGIIGIAIWAGKLDERVLHNASDIAGHLGQAAHLKAETRIEVLIREVQTIKTDIREMKEEMRARPLGGSGP